MIRRLKFGGRPAAEGQGIGCRILTELLVERMGDVVQRLPLLGPGSESPPSALDLGHAPEQTECDLTSESASQMDVDIAVDSRGR